MYSLDNYGVFYTPRKLASFVVDILIQELNDSLDFLSGQINILDPACGEGILLEELLNKLKLHTDILPHCIGIDIDHETINLNKQNFDSEQYTFLTQNSIIPSNELEAHSYWKSHLSPITCVIANPPWSSEKVFNKQDLTTAGYRLITGQYDSYVLFLELCLRLIPENGFLAFIIPDSLFYGENKSLRKFLLETSEIKVLARLGEKLFPDVNRATSVIILRNTKPNENSKTKCYRLDTESRKKFLENTLDLFDDFQEKNHIVFQKRFLENQNFVFDIDTRENEEDLLNKMEKHCIVWNDLFHFGRGVEISKSGAVVTCGNCELTQGYSKKQFSSGQKVCSFCGQNITLTDSLIFNIIFDTNQKGLFPIYVGENLKRYTLTGTKYIRPNVNGINYKRKKQYQSPKILIRKTGLGIYATIDYNSTYTNQTIYSLTSKCSTPTIPLEYYLGILNSRLIYYYYLKKYGENEWKSHPYLTKDIIFSLPIKAVNANNQCIALQIAQNVRLLQQNYNRNLDIQTENLVMQLYDITPSELNLITNELNSLPALSAIDQMKLKDGELDV